MHDIYLYFPAIIIIIGTSLGDDDVIILAPPTSVLVTEGDAVSLPCIGSRGTAPTFSLDGVAPPTSLSNPYTCSLDFASIDLSDNGTYTCQIGEATATVTINVTAMIRKYKFASVYIVPCN